MRGGAWRGRAGRCGGSWGRRQVGSAREGPPDRFMGSCRAPRSPTGSVFGSSGEQTNCLLRHGVLARSRSEDRVFAHQLWEVVCFEEQGQQPDLQFLAEARNFAEDV